jgi:hypothetical protein
MFINLENLRIFMKTLKFFIVVGFIVAFAVNNAKSQNDAIKGEFTWDSTGTYLPCTNDILFGVLTWEYISTPHNLLYKVRTHSTITGVPSGKKYVLTVTSPGDPDLINPTWYEQYAQWRVEGKLVATEMNEMPQYQMMES